MRVIFNCNSLLLLIITLIFGEGREPFIVGVFIMIQSLKAGHTALLQTVSLAALVLATPLSAAEQAEMEVAQLDVISVHATRNPLRAYDVPGQVSVVGQEAIEDLNPSSLSDIFDRIPGAQFDGGPRRSGEVPSIRGLSGEGVLILLDGARQSFVSGHDGRIFVDPEVLQAVEVIRGPSSALYGSGALGGIIGLRTLSASDLTTDSSTVLKVRAGFDTVKDERHVTLTGAHELMDGKVGVIASGTFRDSDDIRLGSGLDLPANDTVWSGLLKADAQLSKTLDVTATWVRYALDTTDPNNPQDASIADPSNDEVDRHVTSDTFIGKAAFNPKSDYVDLEATAYGAITEVEEDETGSTRSITRRVNTVGLNLQNRSHLDDWMMVISGFEAHRDNQKGEDNSTMDGSRGGVPDATAWFYGGFVQAEITIEDQGLPGTLTFLPGIRFDGFTNSADGSPSTDDTALSPKFAGRYEPVEWLMIFGNVNKAYRAPGFNEIYADGTHFSIPNLTLPGTFVRNEFIINPDLEPEESVGWEVGGGLDFSNIGQKGDRLMVKASYWSARVDNLIDLEVNIPAGCFGAPFQPCGSGQSAGNTSQYVNVRNARLDGVEAELNYESTTLYTHMNFSAINGEDEATGAPVGILYPNRLHIDAGVYPMPSKAIRLGGRVTWADDFTEAEPAERRDGYTVFDLYASYEPVSGVLEGFRLDFAVENVGDKDYEVVNAGVSEEGRNFKVAARYRLPL